MKKTKRLVALVLALLLTLSACIVVPTQSAQASSTTTNQDVLDARDGVFLFVIVATVGDTQYWVQAGSCFLINETTILTNYHVVHAYTADDFREALALDSSTSVTVSYGVVTDRDILTTASVYEESQEADFSILTLSKSLGGSAALTLADSDDYEAMDAVWALGFPGIVTDIEDDSIYNSDEVTITGGEISVLSSVVLVNSAIPCFTHTAQLANGNSGGPLLDSNGYVIGINTAMSVDSSGNNDYYYAVQINQIRTVLDRLNIDYQTADSSSTTSTIESDETTTTETTTAAETTAVETTEEDTTSELRATLGKLITSMKSVSTDGYTDDTVSAFESALTAAETIYEDEDATESEIQGAIDSLNEANENLTEKSGIPIVLIAVIAAVVVVLIIVIILIVRSSSKKKKQQQDRGQGYQNYNTPPVQPQPGPGVGNTGGWNQPTGTPVNTASYSSGDGPGTTLLQDDGAGATTVLNAAILPPATLTRKRNGTTVTIDKQSFKIGKEKRNVSLCISDNTNVSRVHAEITYRDGAFYIRDNSSTNGTSVNGVGLSAGQERRLSNGDVLRLADEEFTFRQ